MSNLHHPKIILADQTHRFGDDSYWFVTAAPVANRAPAYLRESFRLTEHQQTVQVDVWTTAGWADVCTVRITRRQYDDDHHKPDLKHAAVIAFGVIHGLDTTTPVMVKS